MARLATTWARLGTGLFLALLLGDVLSPSVAQATCGDYVHTSSEANQQKPIHPTEPFAPCTGPTCSRPDNTPLAPLSVKFSLPRFEGQLAHTIETADPGHSDWVFETTPTAPLGNPTSIYHPPR